MCFNDQLQARTRPLLSIWTRPKAEGFTPAKCQFPESLGVCLGLWERPTGQKHFRSPERQESLNTTTPNLGHPPQTACSCLVLQSCQQAAQPQCTDEDTEVPRIKCLPKGMELTRGKFKTGELRTNQICTSRPWKTYLTFVLRSYLLT